MISVDPKAIPTGILHQYLVGAVAPRPIAFVSTVDDNGVANLAPYSFFNVFSSNPPTCVFSSNRRVRDNTTKDTLHNVQSTGECVINVVNYNIVRQAALCSVEFASEVSEFEQSGLTPIPSDIVGAYRVKESPVQMECKVKQILPLGSEGGAGHLVICEIVKLHLDENILDEDGKIQPHKIDLMGRMGRAFYSRASGESIYNIYQNVTQIGIGYPALPETARKSTILTGNDLAALAGLAAPPAETEISALREKQILQNLLGQTDAVTALHKLAQLEIAKENINEAAALVWLGDSV